MFFQTYRLTQIIAAIQIAAKDAYAMQLAADELVPITIHAHQDDILGDAVAVIVKAGTFCGVMTAYIIESNSADADSDVKDLALNGNPECIWTDSEKNAEDGVEGLILVLDQQFAYFITENQITPTK